MASDRQRVWNESGRRLSIKRLPKLTVYQRQEVRRRLAAGETAKALAAEFGVSKSTINRNR